MLKAINMWTRHLLHPKWKELDIICSEIQSLQDKAHRLRAEIDKDLDKYSDEELSKLPLT